MTGLCRLIRDCAALTAGPFVRRSERRKLAVLIPLFMSSREKKPSTLQPCPLHPFRGRREEGSSGSVAPGRLSFPRALGSPEPPCIEAGVGEGVAFGSLNCQLLENGGNGPTTRGCQWGGLLFASTDGKHGPLCPLFPGKVALGGAHPPSP